MITLTVILLYLIGSDPLLPLQLSCSPIDNTWKQHFHITIFSHTCNQCDIAIYDCLNENAPYLHILHIVLNIVK